MSVPYEIPVLQSKIGDEIGKLSFGQSPENLYQPIDYIMSLGGKRLRPLLTLLSYQLGGKDPIDIIRPALVVEVFHNFTLMHDDIMDNAPIRRGQPAVHEKWNENVAILSGDTMLVKAYDMLLELDTAILPTVIRRFNQTAVEVCEGQQIDMNFETEAEVSEQQYLEMIRLKTAVLLGFSLEYGGLLAGLGSSVAQGLYSIGEKMGIGFQLMDDYLDVYADKAKFGKQVGGDILSNKKTFLLIEALNKASVIQKKELTGWLDAVDYIAEEKVAAVTKIYNEIGIPELTRSKMDAYFDEAFLLLESLPGDQDAKNVIIEFANQLMNREK
jgi:geranylgeranyl diphosphate synthase type II